MTVRITRDDAVASDLRRQAGRVKDGGHCQVVFLG